jgi:predicted HAD superfamily hydrolase
MRAPCDTSPAARLAANAWISSPSLPNWHAAVDQSVLATAAKTSVRLVSFDVFDTVVTRSVGEPTALFRMVGQRLRQQGIVTCSPETFLQQRLLCEARARSNSSSAEISLQQIYEELGDALQLREAVQELMRAELAAEAASILPVPHMVATVDAVRRRFGRVVFVSDMYLPQDFLELQLQRAGLLRNGDRLYVSSTYGVQKRTGHLFRIVAEREGVALSNLLHCGDSFESDVLGARSVGVQAHQVTTATPNQAEEELIRWTSQTEGFAGNQAGAARLARLRGSHLRAEQRMAWETGAGVTGPLVHLFAQWVIRRARQLGVKRLCFLARDGYFPYLATRALLERQPELDLDVNYIYGSRQTYNLLAVTRLHAEEWTQLTSFSGRQFSTIEELSELLCAEPAVLQEHLTPLGFTLDDWTRPLQSEERARIRDQALRNQEFNQALWAQVHRAQAHSREYLIGDVVDGDESIALVDAGWTTKSHAPLFRFLQQLGPARVHMFYFGLVAERPDIPLERVHAFVFDRARRTGVFQRAIEYPRAVETLFLSKDGRTRAFERTGSGVSPVLANTENADFVAQFYDPYESGIRAYLEELTLSLPEDVSIYGADNIAESIVSRFWLNPTEDEARLWSQLEWQWDPAGTVKYPLARPYRVGHVMRAFLQRRHPECGPQFWAAGAFRLTPLMTRNLLAAAILAGRACERPVRRWLPVVRKNAAIAALLRRLLYGARHEIA